ncbi:multidrug transporter [Pseudomonas putida]|uniref:multidrug transporter n=1 Tax=Pseudomonas putida TaxID=303 RepID=UPI003D99BD81
MKLHKTLAFALLLSVGTSVAASNGSGDPLYTIHNPPAYAMIGDLLIARPLLVVATVIGAGVFVVSLPFTAMGGGVGDAGQALVVDPAKAAFVRCLGCIGEGFEQTE